MINKYENTHIEIKIERAVFNIIIKTQQEHPLCSPILIHTVHSVYSVHYTYKRKQYFYIFKSARIDLADIFIKRIERVKGAQSEPNPSPNAFPKIHTPLTTLTLLTLKSLG